MIGGTLTNSSSSANGVYVGNNSITSITDPIGRTVSYTYNSSGTLATVTDPNGGVTSYQYDSQNRMTSMIDPRGVTMFQNTFDANGRVIQQVAADGGVYQFAYTLINPTAPTSPVMTSTLTDPLGNQTPTALIPKATPYRRPTLPAKRLPSTALRVPICC